MLRDAISKVQITQEDIESFYSIVTENSYKKDEPLAKSLEILRKNYFEYLRVCLEAPAAKEKFLKEKKAYLLSLIKIIRSKNFFADNVKILDAVESNIAKNAEGFEKFDEEVCAEIMKNVRDIQDRCQSSVPLAEKTYPDKISTGLSSSEMLGLTYSPFYQTGSVSCGLNAKGLEHFNKKEWEAAISLFERAIQAEREIAEEAKQASNVGYLVIFQRNISSSYHSWALGFYNNKQYQEAIPYLQKALEALDKIRIPTREDKQTKMNIFRQLAYSYSFIGGELLDKNLYSEAVGYFQKAIDTQNKVHEENRDEGDYRNISAFYRDLAKAWNGIADAEFLAGHNDETIETFKKVFAAFDNISMSAKEDQIFSASCNRKLAIVYNHRGNVHFLAGRHLAAKEDYQSAKTVFNKIPLNQRMAGDKHQEQMYVSNLRNLLRILSFQQSTAYKRLRLFRPDTPAEMSDSSLNKRRKFGH